MSRYIVYTKRSNEPIAIPYDRKYRMRLMNLHREDGPAVYEYIGDELVSIEYRKNGFLHREDGPARIIYEDGKVISEEWFVNDKRHREDGPGEISYCGDEVIHESWFLNGFLHREDGPAVLNLDTHQPHYRYAIKGTVLQGENLKNFLTKLTINII